MDFQFVLDYLLSNLEGVVVKDQKIVARCPICGDSKKSRTKKRFILKYDSEEDIYYRCWNCYTTNELGDGHFVELYAYLENISVSDAYNKLYSINSKIHRIKHKIVERKTETSKKVESSPINIFNYIREDSISIFDEPKGCLDKRYLSILKDFSINRKINQEIFFAFKGNYKNRILIPIFNENKDIIYFQARRTIETDEPKYINPSVEKQSIILNKEKFDRSKHIIITEGLIDAFTIGEQGTSCLGASITDEFLEKLINLTDQGLIIALDNDKTGLISVLNLIETSVFASKMKYFIISDKYNVKDINELSVKSNISNMYDFIESNSMEHYIAMYYIKKKIERLRTENYYEDSTQKCGLLGNRWNELRQCLVR